MAIITHIDTKKIHNLREKFGCSQRVMGDMIGVSERTVARWESDKSEPSPLARQRVRELENIVIKMAGVIKKGKEAEWLNTPNEALGGKTPLEVLIQGPEGAQEVWRLLGRLEWGIAT